MPAPRNVRHASCHPVATIIERTAKSHAEAARTKKEHDERERLAPRGRIAMALFAAVKKELAAKRLNGVDRSDQRLAVLCEETAKHIAKNVGLESHSKRD